MEVRTIASSTGHIDETIDGAEFLDQLRMGHPIAFDNMCVRRECRAVPAGGSRQEHAARDLLARLDAAAAAATGDEGGDGERAALAKGFLLEVAVVRHLQADPLLPDELLPPDWPADRLRIAYADHDRTYKRRLATWITVEAVPST